MEKSVRDFLIEIRKQISEITHDELSKELQQKSSVVLIDVRETEEFSAETIEGSIHLSRGLLEMKIETQVADKTKKIILFCATGIRSLLAARTLSEIGYSNVFSLSGGIKAWKDMGYKIVHPNSLSLDSQSRYRAQINIPEVKVQGQTRLAQAKVLVVGAGGLGSPALFYLAAAGVGTIGIIDDDVVDLSNLHRQIIHTSDRIGLPKVDSAYQTLNNLNPFLQIQIYKERLTSENVDRIFSNYDFVVDGCDNYPTRYLINDACIKNSKVNIHGAIFQFQGQCSVFGWNNGPCYRCLFQDPPTGDLAPNCAEAGVLGILPGIIGTLQATETLKCILGIGENLSGTLLQYDALTQDTQKLNIEKNPSCPICSIQKDKIKYIDYVGFCRT